MFKWRHREGSVSAGFGKELVSVAIARFKVKSCKKQQQSDSIAYAREHAML